MSFARATKKKQKARVALIGPSGSGKTYTALQFGKTLGKKIALIDTERGSASKYAGDVADFDVCELHRFEPQKYIDAMREAAAEGYDVIVVDSLTHAWTGEGGLLDQKDKHQGKNSFDAWRHLTPQHNALIDAILGYPGHVIATMRVKTEYVIEDVGGKKVPRKVGLAPVQRDGLEYEFDVVADMDPDNCMHVSKSRCPALVGAAVRKPGADVAKTLLAWLDDGVEPAPKTSPVDVVDLAQQLIDQIDALETRHDLNAMRDSLNSDPPKLTKALAQKVRDAVDRAKKRVDEMETVTAATEGAL